MPSIWPDGCVETSVICRLAGVPKSTLDYWVRSGLVAPSVRRNPGHRVSRLWTVEDAVLARAIKVLRDAGCPVRVLKKAQAFLRSEWKPMLGSSHLFWDGSDLFRIGEWDAVESIVQNPGQQAFRMVTLPVDAWAEELLGEIVPLPTKAARGQKKAS
jgi:DNA-binding transcriptional MerR regulator